ncbi:hypothetical protein MANES_02G210140v8 [Manihot esculenta]|uniref:Uncharacterized protein n=1 Tax=Manihot esculenta TaxID=3983 RepID=A0ACB7I7S2_MANES|nr:hypothetical protein MANES_02G210140v8 [Manihot esculenta]
MNINRIEDDEEEEDTEMPLPFSIVGSPWTKPLLRTAAKIGPNVSPPSAYEIAEVYLKYEYNEMKKYIASLPNVSPPSAYEIVEVYLKNEYNEMKKYIASFDGIWKERGVTIMCDGWSGPTHMSIVNFLVYSNRGTMLHKSIDASNVEHKDGEYYFKIMKEVVEEIGLKKLSKCAHCIDLILEDIGKKKSVQKIIDQAKKFTDNRDIFRLGITRFATNFIALESIVRYRVGLRNMFESEQWMMIKGDDKPTMGFIYEAMERAKLAIQKNSRSYLEYWRIIDHRWNFQLHHDLHAAGYFLNPQYQYGPHDIGNNNEIILGLKNVIQRLEGDLVNQGKALNQVSNKLILKCYYVSVVEGLKLEQLLMNLKLTSEWWINYGESALELRKIAIKVLSQTTSASNCERNWSTFSLIHTKTRNRLKYQKLHALVFVHYNMRLKIRNVTRKSQQELDRSYDPINLDYIFEEDDPLNSWLEERESPLLDGQPNPWLDGEEASNAQSQSESATQTQGQQGAAGGGGTTVEGGGSRSSQDPPSQRQNGIRIASEPSLMRTYQRSQDSHSSSTGGAETSQTRGEGVAYEEERSIDSLNYGYNAGTYNPNFMYGGGTGGSSSSEVL